MTYDEQWAKDLSLRLWTWLRDNPSCVYKTNTPMYEGELRNLRGACPLCEIAQPRNGRLVDCIDTCPLRMCCDEGKNTGFYERWRHARSIKARYRAASVIVKLLEAWDITGGKE